MVHGFRVPKVSNEPIHGYEPGSALRASLEARLKEMRAQNVEIPLEIGGKEVRTGRTGNCIEPHRHQNKLGTFHKAGKAEVESAIQAAAKAWPAWSSMAFEHRAAIFLKAADLISGPYRSTLNGATMLGQSKTVIQAEIDAACELIDFLRFNVTFAEQIHDLQPNNVPLEWNRMDYRPLEGFVFAITPFNFTAIGGNLPTAPAIMGNTVLWKPASTAVYSAHHLLQVLKKAGLPDGVINFVPGSGSEVGDPVLASPALAGIHFTGSTDVFRGIWKTIGENIARYRSYPRIVGETGGKDFVFAHVSADTAELVTALIRGAFEYQGQKCSAASRAYVPSSRWPEVKDALVGQTRELRMGDPTDLRNFMAAVIDRAAFKNISDFIDHARKSPDANLLAGGGCDDSTGYFIEPTIIEAKDPRYRTMCEEIFGPVLTVHVYPDAEIDRALEHCDQDSQYALTGSIFARDRKAIASLSERLRNAAGNFYINDKPTGAVVGRQPFGGARGSGTNDKAGSVLNLLRWTSPRAIKENLCPPTSYRHPHMG